MLFGYYKLYNQVWKGDNRLYSAKDGFVKCQINMMKLKVGSGQVQQFKEDDFMNEIKSGKATLNLSDDKHLSKTEKAYLMAFNPNKKIKSDYECMLNDGNDGKTAEMDIQGQTIQKWECLN